MTGARAIRGSRPASARIASAGLWAGVCRAARASARGRGPARGLRIDERFAERRPRFVVLAGEVPPYVARQQWGGWSGARPGPAADLALGSSQALPHLRWSARLWSRSTIGPAVGNGMMAR